MAIMCQPYQTSGGDADDGEAVKAEDMWETAVPASP